MRRATIDIGSNSTLLLIGDIEENQSKQIYSESIVTGLGRDLDVNKKFLDEAMVDTYDALKKYSELCQEHKVEQIVATATEASRVATNAPDFYKKVKTDLGFDVTIITGEGEAYYSARGLLFGPIDDEEIYIMDIGGASTELIHVKTNPFKIEKSTSLPMGAVRMTSWLKENKNLEKVQEIFNHFDTLGYKTKKLFCVAGTMTSVANMHMENKEFNEQKVNNHHMSTNDIFEMIQKFQGYTAEQFLAEFPFLGKRSRTIEGGLNVAESIF
jgi:exopolyphosphatase/guanosine-5'-triphosphate,3'-diphosphate pyrophosphatase